MGIPFFDRVWPLEVSLRTGEVSQALVRLPAALDAAFPSAVEKIVPLIVPFTVWDVDSVFIFLESTTGEVATKRAENEDRRAFAARNWSAALDLIDAALGAAPTVVPINLDVWLRDIGTLARDAIDDQRYKRLLRELCAKVGDGMKG